MVDILMLGAGVMAGNQARAFRMVPEARLVGLVSPNHERRAAFAAEHGIARTFANLEEALDWGGFDAATNVTPDPVHHPTTLGLIAAGKHVLCEKPLSTNYKLALDMTEAAEAAVVVNMVNFSYRDAAALQEARRRVLAGELGEVRHLGASYLQSWLVGDGWRSERRRLSKVSSRHSGPLGTLGDTGVHLLDFLTYAIALDVADLDCRLKTFRKADGDRIGEYVLDVNDTYLLSVELSNGAIGNVEGTRLAAGHFNDLSLSIYGTKGALTVFTNGRMSSLKGCLGQTVAENRWQEIDCPAVPTIYERFVAAIRTGGRGEPDFRRGAEIQRLIDVALLKGRQRTSG